MKIEIDRGKCVGLGICESISPKYFELGDDVVLTIHLREAEDAELSEVQEAVRGCPTAALRLVP